MKARKNSSQEKALASYARAKRILPALIDLCELSCCGLREGVALGEAETRISSTYSYRSRPATTEERIAGLLSGIYRPATDDEWGDDEEVERFLAGAILFSHASTQEDWAAPMQAYIEQEQLGTVSVVHDILNPNTRNIITLYVWNLNAPRCTEFVHANKLALEEK